jgi:hypothetical protein
LVALFIKVYISPFPQNCMRAAVFTSASAQEGCSPEQNLRITTMKTTLRIVCLSAAVWAVILPVLAQTAPNTVQTPPNAVQIPPNQKPATVNQRLERQQDRIGQGITSGQLTAGEAANLETKESAITNEVRADRQANGGKLTQAERVQVNHQLNRTSKQIYRDKHNGNRQPH